MKLRHYDKTMHLQEYQLMPQKSACLFCHSQDRFSVALLQENPTITLLRCKVCQAVSASRIPTEETLRKFYDDYYNEKFYYGQEKKVTFDLTKKFAGHIIEKAAKHLNRGNLNILDFGGGDGSISIQLAKEFLTMGWPKINIMIIDYNEVSATVDDERIYLNCKTEIDDLPIEKYDIVIASAIIEHLPKPREILIGLLDLVKVDGLFYARTPYLLPFMKLASALGLQWDFHYPSHLHDLGPPFWNTVFSNFSSNDRFSILASQPSVVETSFKKHFLRTLAAYILKFPWHLFGNKYKMVGGWEIFAMKKS